MKYVKFFLVIIFVSLATPVFAYTNLSEGMDNSLVAGITNDYSFPEEIVITQIDGNFENMNMSTKQYIDTLYYYSITKLRLPYLPYHYIMTRSGEVYQVSSLDSVQTVGKGKIVVGYLSNNPIVPDNTGIKLKEFVSELSSKYGISKYSVQSLQIEPQENTFTRISLTGAQESFSQSVDQALQDFEPSSRENMSYKATIVSVEHEESVEIGKRLDVKLTVRNENDFIWFSTKDPIYVSVKDSKESPYAVNQVWDSFSKPTSIDSSIFVMPGETVEISFQIDPKIAPGDASETFVLLKFDGEEFEDSEFTIDFKVEKGDSRLLSINSPEYGFVNVRECRWYSCDVLSVANDGEVYIVLSEEEGWYKVAFGQEQEGWISGRYIELL
jgi:hypothetical protein